MSSLHHTDPVWTFKNYIWYARRDRLGTCTKHKSKWVTTHQIISETCTTNTSTTNKTEYNRHAKFSREIDTAKLTEPLIALHLLRSLEGKSTDRYDIVQWTKQRWTGRDNSVFPMFESMRGVACWHWVGLQTFYFQDLSQQQGPGKKKPELPTDGYYCSCTWMYLVKSWEKNWWVYKKPGS